MAVFLSNLKSHKPDPDFTANYLIYFLQKNVPKFPIT